MNRNNTNWLRNVSKTYFRMLTENQEQLAPGLELTPQQRAIILGKAGTEEQAMALFRQHQDAIAAGQGQEGDHRRTINSDFFISPHKSVVMAALQSQWNKPHGFESGDPAYAYNSNLHLPLQDRGSGSEGVSLGRTDPEVAAAALRSPYINPSAALQHTRDHPDPKIRQLARDLHLQTFRAQEEQRHQEKNAWARERGRPERPFEFYDPHEPHSGVNPYAEGHPGTFNPDLA